MTKSDKKLSIWYDNEYRLECKFTLKVTVPSRASGPVPHIRHLLLPLFTLLNKTNPIAHVSRKL